MDTWIPYTLPRRILTLFILLRQGDQHIWKEKLAWVAQKGGMALLNAHPDYMYWGGEKRAVDEYYYDRYTDFLHYVNGTYRNQYWQALPREVARFWKNASRLAKGIMTRSSPAMFPRSRTDLSCYFSRPMQRSPTAAGCS